MEGTHRKLRSRLADGLRRDNTDGLADVHRAVSRESATVARLAHALRALALGRRTHRDHRLAWQLPAPFAKKARRYVRAGLGYYLARLRVYEITSQEAGRD